MIPTDFPESNKTFGPPRGLEESQVQPIHAYIGTVDRGSCEGSPCVITAWQPTAEELARLKAGAPIFVSFLFNALPPHMLTTSFEAATHPA